jgi:hypothetical protein
LQAFQYDPPTLDLFDPIICSRFDCVVVVTNREDIDFNKYDTVNEKVVFIPDIGEERRRSYIDF